ncbi:hypothetical protein K6755_02365 [Faecalibacterium prausnitzii]
MKKVLLFEQKMQFCHNAQKGERYIWQSDETSTGWGQRSGITEADSLQQDAAVL